MRSLIRAREVIRAVLLEKVFTKRHLFFIGEWGVVKFDGSKKWVLHEKLPLLTHDHCWPMILVDWKIRTVNFRKSFIKKLKTPTSKVTKLEFRGEGALHRYPKRLKRFHFYRGIFQRGLTDITQIMHEYNRMQAEENLREDDGRDVSDSGRVPDPLSAEVRNIPSLY